MRSMQAAFCWYLTFLAENLCVTATVDTYNANQQIVLLIILIIKYRLASFPPFFLISTLLLRVTYQINIPTYSEKMETHVAPLFGCYQR